MKTQRNIKFFEYIYIFVFRNILGNIYIYFGIFGIYLLIGYRDIKMWDLILNKYSRFEKDRSLRLMLNVPYIFP